MATIKTTKINFSAESMINIHSLTVMEHRLNFIEALKICKTDREVKKVIMAALNILHEKEQ